MASNFRKLLWLLRNSRYSSEIGWHSPAPDGSRIARRKLLDESSFYLLIAPNGIRVPLEGLDDLDTTVDIFYRAHYKKMLDSVCPGTILIDVGANIGVTSLMFAKEKNIGHVYAYEPMPHTYERAQETLAANPDAASKVTIYPFGLGDKDAFVGIRYTKKAKCAIGTARIPDNLVERYRINQSDMERMTIRVADAARILRNVSDKHPGAPVVLKIDAEGAEYGIIDRLAHTRSLGRVSYVAVEWHFDPGPDFLVSRLEALGFETTAKALEDDNSIGMIDAWRHQFVASQPVQ